MTQSVDLYGTAYTHFSQKALEDVRRETYGEDIGQSGWITAEEYREFFTWLELTPACRVLDLCSGSGGPAVFLSMTTGCSVTGLDINENGIRNANRLAAERGLHSAAEFLQADVTRELPAASESYDAIVCIDAIIHLPGRPGVLQQCHRVLKPGGRLLYTDPTIITGLVSKEEIALRASIGHFDFSSPGVNEAIIAGAGFELTRADDRTENAVRVSRRWHDARAARRDEIVAIEGESTFEGLQRFLWTVHTLTAERRLSRYVFTALKPAA